VTATIPARVAWLEEAARLRANSGEWQLIATRPVTPGGRHGARSMASQINRGALYAFRPPGDFEARTEGHEVHARYLGDG
jgi:hypothetical protein